MLNWFRKKRLSPQEELERVLLDGFKNLKHSISLREPLKRRVAVTSALGALITTIKGYYPNTAIEEDGMAMSILHDCGSPAQWDDVEEVLDSLGPATCRSISWKGEPSDGDVLSSGSPQN